ncbi:hypothetical protein KDW_21690 [Dictyobacter vulcani]|uniref:Major facilitator superfamily (MFS) profile domain-containing protein n=1 Tax=Dictyobacter vulcani TaxID=2607529 RepID=A0A5J4KNJ1_9CHLR|nr:MFS transporter [Dictyobacter vulcani]GER88007.1 hypothetical protein KDW_21690 [Dictyobacter vulcani]
MYTFEDDNETSSRYQRTLYTPSDQTESDRELMEPEIDHKTKVLPENAVMVPEPARKTRTLADDPTLEDLPTLPGHTPAVADQKATRGARAAIIVACIGVFLTALDQTVVVTALPQVITDLQIPLTQLDHAAWIISAYLLGFVVAMPLMGRVSDIYGRRRIFLLCLLIFGVGSILCGLAPILGTHVSLQFLGALHIDTSSPGLIWLIGARVLQAIGGGALVPVAMAIASDVYTLKKRALALGVIGAVTEAGGAIGPLYGALIVEHLGWQYIFYLNVPLVIALFVGAWIFIPRGKRLPEGIDWLGALFIALALTCLSLGLAQQGTSLGPGAASAVTPQNNPLSLVLAVVFLLAFILVERKVRWPVVDLQLFKHFQFSAAALVSLLVGAALIIAMADIPIFVDTVLQSSVLDSGLALLRLTVMIPIGALLGGWLSHRITCRLTAIIGLVFTAIGFYLMSRWPIHADWNLMTAATVTAGFGFGLVVAPIGTTAINAVRTTQVGMSSSIVTALRMVGMIFGLAALTSWALAYFRQLSLAFPTSPEASSGNPLSAYASYLIGAAHTVYCTVFFISAILCLLAIVPALFLWGRALPVGIQASDIDQLPTVPIVQRAPSAAPKRNVITILLAIMLVLSSGLATYLIINSASTKSGQSTDLAGAPRKIDLALNQTALTSIFASQLGQQQKFLKHLVVTPAENDRLLITFDLVINLHGIQRTLPIELDSSMYLDKKQNMQLAIQRVKRDGLDAGPTVAQGMQTALNQMLLVDVMPAIHQQLKDIKIISIHTSKHIVCSKGAIEFVLQIEATTIQGISAQSLPSPICFNTTLDFKKLFHK